MEEKILDENPDNNGYFLADPKNKYSRYCGGNLFSTNWNCSDYCLAKYSAWNRM